MVTFDLKHVYKCILVNETQYCMFFMATQLKYHVGFISLPKHVAMIPVMDNPQYK